MSTATLLVSCDVTYTKQGKRNTMEKVKAFADWLTKWFTVIVIVWAVFNYFVPAASLWARRTPATCWASCCSAWA